jgi:serine/threonine-protein kinase
VGTTLDGRYVLSAHLATGGMGAVFRAHHVHLRKDVAVKVLRADLTGSPDIVERFRREAEIASALEHDNIVRVTDFGRSESGHLFIVMELLSGESLFERLRREGFLPPEEAVPILWQICAALEAAHALGVIHRDLKPENVFLARTGSGREVTKLLDFGIAKITDPAKESETQAGIVVGTPEYLSPEQAMGTPIDGRADLYAVGLIAWRALAGRHPFKADDARSLLMMQATRPVPRLTEARPDLADHPALVEVVARACAKEPGERHQTAAVLRDELAAALGPAFMMPPGATPAPSPPAAGGSTPPSARRKGAGASAPPGAPSVPAWPASDSPTAAVAPAVSAPRGRMGALARAAGARATAARLAASRLRSSAVARASGAARDVASRVRRNPLPWILAGAAIALLALLAALLVWREGRAAAHARELLERDRPAEARAVIDGAIARRPGDRDLLLLRGKALHRLPGRAGDGIEAYAAASAQGPLDAAAFEDLVQDLGRERSLADKASRLLRDDPERALPAILRAAAEAPGTHRLRALALARDLGAEERVDRVAAYGGLLSDGECEARRAAARRLGEIGDAAALPPLRKAARATVETKGFFGRTSTAPACGAAEAGAAVRRIEAARLPATRGASATASTPRTTTTFEERKRSAGRAKSPVPDEEGRWLARTASRSTPPARRRSPWPRTRSRSRSSRRTSAAAAGRSARSTRSSGAPSSPPRAPSGSRGSRARSCSSPPSDARRARGCSSSASARATARSPGCAGRGTRRCGWRRARPRGPRRRPARARSRSPSPRVPAATSPPPPGRRRRGRSSGPTRSAATRRTTRLPAPSRRCGSSSRPGGSGPGRSATRSRCRPRSPGRPPGRAIS